MHENDLPICMQSDWNPLTPGREMRDRLFDQAELAAAEGDLDERDRLLALASEEF